MAPEFYNYFEDTKHLAMELGERQKLYKFWITYSDRNNSSSKVGHIARGWFTIYDHPLAMKWFRSQDDIKEYRMDDTSYAIFECENLSKAVEAKLMWC